MKYIIVFLLILSLVHAQNFELGDEWEGLEDAYKIKTNAQIDSIDYNSYEPFTEQIQHQADQELAILNGNKQQIDLKTPDVELKESKQDSDEIKSVEYWLKRLDEEFPEDFPENFMDDTLLIQKTEKNNKKSLPNKPQVFIQSESITEQVTNVIGNLLLSGGIGGALGDIASIQQQEQVLVMSDQDLESVQDGLAYVIDGVENEDTEQQPLQISDIQLEIQNAQSQQPQKVEVKQIKIIQTEPNVQQKNYAKKATKTTNSHNHNHSQKNNKSIINVNYDDNEFDDSEDQLDQIEQVQIQYADQQNESFKKEQQSNTLRDVNQLYSEFEVQNQNDSLDNGSQNLNFEQQQVQLDLEPQQQHKNQQQQSQQQYQQQQYQIISQENDEQPQNNFFQREVEVIPTKEQEQQQKETHSYYKHPSDLQNEREFYHDDENVYKHKDYAPDNSLNDLQKEGINSLQKDEQFTYGLNSSEKKAYELYTPQQNVIITSTNPKEREQDQKLIDSFKSPEKDQFWKNIQKEIQNPKQQEQEQTDNKNELFPKMEEMTIKEPIAKVQKEEEPKQIDETQKQSEKFSSKKYKEEKQQRIKEVEQEIEQQLKSKKIHKKVNADELGQNYNYEESYINWKLNTNQKIKDMSFMMQKTNLRRVGK